MAETILKRPPSELNKRTAILYVAAALLILAVGLRMLNALISETDALGFFEYLMMGAIVLQFAVLLYYAELIRKLPDDSGPPSFGTIKDGRLILTMDGQFIQAFEEIRTGLIGMGRELQSTRTQALTAQQLTQDYVQRLQKNEEMILQLSKQLAVLLDEIVDMSRDKLRLAVRSELEMMVTLAAKGRRSEDEIQSGTPNPSGEIKE